MQAILIQNFGDPSQVKLQEVPTPEPKADELLIQVKAATINPSDVKNVAGKMHGTTLPRIPGRDFAGTVVRGPADLLGKDVWGTGGEISRTRDGSHAQFLLLPRTSVALKPANLSMESAGAAGLSFVTAWQAIVTVGQIKPGETALIFGTTGGVGSAALQIAKAHGARVIAVVRSNEDIPTVKSDGADEALNARTTNIPDAVRQLTAGNGAHLSFDSSGMMFNEAIESAAPDARIPVVAASPDGTTTFNLRTLYRKMLTVKGIDTLRIDSTTATKLLTQLTPGFEKAQYKLKPPRPIPLSQAPEAYAQAAKGGGRIVLTPNP